MNKQTEIGFHNRYKAAALMKTEISPEIAEKVAEVYALIKVKKPKLYERIQRSEAKLKTMRQEYLADLDKPETIAFLDELAAKSTVNRFGNELTLLGVTPTATKREIKNAYRRKARKLHPDAGGSEDEFKLLHEAYRTLLKQALND